MQEKQPSNTMIMTDLSKQDILDDKPPIAEKIVCGWGKGEEASTNSRSPNVWKKARAPIMFSIFLSFSVSLLCRLYKLTLLD